MEIPPAVPPFPPRRCPIPPLPAITLWTWFHAVDVRLTVPPMSPNPKMPVAFPPDPPVACPRPPIPPRRPERSFAWKRVWEPAIEYALIPTASPPPSPGPRPSPVALLFPPAPPRTFWTVFPWRLALNALKRENPAASPPMPPDPSADPAVAPFPPTPPRSPSAVFHRANVETDASMR